MRPDGTITMPLVGDIKAAGRTPSSLKSEITRRLQSFVRDDSAIVSVAVTEVNSYRFTVAGQVEHAGLLTAKYYVTASEAIAMAGGLNRFANPHKLTLVRNDSHGLRRIPIDYERIASGLHPEEISSFSPATRSTPSNCHFDATASRSRPTRLLVTSTRSAAAATRNRIGVGIAGLARPSRRGRRCTSRAPSRSGAAARAALYSASAVWSARPPSPSSDARLLLERPVRVHLDEDPVGPALDVDALRDPGRDARGGRRIAAGERAVLDAGRRAPLRASASGPVIIRSRSS